MKRPAIVSFFLLYSLSSIIPQNLISTPYAYPGEILTALVSNAEAGDELNFVLWDQEGTICSHAPGLVFESEDMMQTITIGLLGLAPDIEPGIFTIRSETRNSGGLNVVDRTVLIRSRDFAQEDIHLSESMSHLQEDDSAVRNDQARRLWGILKEFHKDVVKPVGPFLPPLREFIESSLYGDRRSYIHPDGSRSVSIHNGIDMAAPSGSEVLTPLKGKVVLAEERIITGKTVVVEHLPGVYSLYYHLHTMEVNEGDFLSQGDRMGTVGSTGLATGPHLHWELRVNAIPVDPGKYLTSPLIDKDRILSIMNETIQKGR